MSSDTSSDESHPSTEKEVSSNLMPLHRLDEFTVKLLQDMYRAEVDQKHRIDGGLSISMGILFALAGALWFYIETLKKMPVDQWGIWLPLSCIALSVFLCYGAVCSIGVLWRHKIKHIGWPSAYKRYWEQLRETGKQHYEQLRSYHEHYDIQRTDQEKSLAEEADEVMLTYMRRHMISIYSTATERIFQVNMWKALFRHRINACISISLVIFVQSLIPFIRLYLSRQ